MKACSIYHAKQASTADVLLPSREELCNYVAFRLWRAIFRVFPALFAFTFISNNYKRDFAPIDSAETRKYGEWECTDESGLREKHSQDKVLSMNWHFILLPLSDYQKSSTLATRMITWRRENTTVRLQGQSLFLHCHSLNPDIRAKGMRKKQLTHG